MKFPLMIAPGELGQFVVLRAFHRAPETSLPSREASFTGWVEGELRRWLERRKAVRR